MRVNTGQAELDVTVTGEGEPVLTIHGAFTVGTFDAMAEEPALRDEYQLITYHRRGYGDSSQPEEPYSVADVVQDALAVLREAGGDRGHVVGHSLGGVYALEMALLEPDAVQSLTLIEPVIPTPEWDQFAAENIVPAVQAYAGGDSRAAIEMMFGAVYGSTRYGDEMDHALPEGWFDQAVDGANALFTIESVAAQEWSFGPERAKQIRQPVLLIRGAETEPVFLAMHEQLKEWIPRVEEYVEPDVNHFCQVLSPENSARALASFLAANSLSDATATG